MLIERKIYKKLINSLEPGKVVIIYGPRRAGKTFLLEYFIDRHKSSEKILFVNGESAVTKDVFSSFLREKIASYIGEATTLIIDEAQAIPEVGRSLKFVIDSFPDLKVVVSGSASFDLAQKVGEPLTGRKKTLFLYPISVGELVDVKDADYFLSGLEERLVFGGYPELFSIPSRDEKKEYLRELIDSYLFKDILQMEELRAANKLRDLLTLLAFQIGKEVSLSELGSNLDLHKDTVARYIDLLEKAFVLIRIGGFSRNLRKEITKNSRYYFFDVGVRNALINNFNSLNLRDDVGMLWENFLVVERLKKQSYDSIQANNYFWRTYDKKEIDWVEEREGKLHGYEITWGDCNKKKEPKDWRNTYMDATYQCVDQDNFLGFII